MILEDALRFVDDRAAKLGWGYHELLRRQGRLARLEELDAPRMIIEHEQGLIERSRNRLVALGWDGGAVRVHRTPYDLDNAIRPETERVQLRGLALAALSRRARIELAGDKEAVVALQAWTEEHLASHLYLRERRMVQATQGSLDKDELVSTSWRIEGAAVLAWALGRFDLPEFDRECGARKVESALGLLSPERVPASLRTRDELIEAFEMIFAVHWRLVDFRVQPVAKSFPELGESEFFWFGPLRTEGVQTSKVDGVMEDLSIGGVALPLAHEEDLQRANSIVVERRQALGWLCGLAEHYDDVPLDT